MDSDETLAQFIARRRPFLEQEAKRLRAELASIEHELQQLRLLGAPRADSRATASTGHGERGTIQDIVVQILRERGSGMTANELLPEVNKRRGTAHGRESLSPQLSRLKAMGILRLIHKNWVLSEWATDAASETEDTQLYLPAPDGRQKSILD